MSSNPVPVLYVLGDSRNWHGSGAVAVVGSRNIQEPYSRCAHSISAMAAKMGMLIVSGLALGADSIGHMSAMEANGRTLCVMPCGLDNVFPPENRLLWEKLREYDGAAFVSKFRFGRRASSLLLRKRNKLIVSFSQGVVVAQSAANGGAMNAYRCGCEQRKLVSTFKPDASETTTGNNIISTDTKTGACAFHWINNEASCMAWLEQLSSLT